MSAWTCRRARSPQRLFHLVLGSHDGRCYGAAAWILHPSFAVNRWSSHADVEQLESVPPRPRTSQHIDCGHRDEPVELARCRYRAWHRASAIEEAGGQRITEAAASMAGGSGESR